MKKGSIVLALLLSFSFVGFAKSFYINLGLGYNLPVAVEIPLGIWTIGNSEFNGSFGKGASFTSSIGFAFNESISAELGLSFLVGKEY